jgi:DNA-binding NtrC family response regulator
VRAASIIVEPPAFNNVLGLGERGESVHVQTLMARSAVKRFNKGIFYGFAGPNKVELQDALSPVDGSRLKASRDHREKELVRLTMEKAEGNVTRAASSLGVSRPTVYQLLARYGLKKTRAEDHKEKA